MEAWEYALEHPESPWTIREEGHGDTEFSFSPGGGPRAHAILYQGSVPSDLVRLLKGGSQASLSRKPWVFRTPLKVGMRPNPKGARKYLEFRTGTRQPTILWFPRGVPPALEKDLRGRLKGSEAMKKGSEPGSVFKTRPKNAAMKSIATSKGSVPAVSKKPSKMINRTGK